ncbi:hypothetical protein WMF18_35305 [Sorangium sp. So ce315]|uniref:hypothetical protein n=1 Tax=Sorangium sp. So ce315 TaxID=3133299 RepID=UPI003F5DF171
MPEAAEVAPVAVVAMVAVMPVMPVMAVVAVMPMVAVMPVMLAEPAGARLRRAGCTRLLDERKVLNRRGAGRTSERSDSNHRGGHKTTHPSQLFHCRFLPLCTGMLTCACRVMDW